MGECVSVIVDYGYGESDVLRIVPLRLQLHLNRLDLYSQKYTQLSKMPRPVSTFKH